MFSIRSLYRDGICTDTIFKILLYNMTQAEGCTKGEEDVDDGEYHMPNRKLVYYASRKFSRTERDDVLRTLSSCATR
jgi:hypothetical protein